MSNQQLLMERYPEIGFYYTFDSFDPFELFLDREGLFNAKRGDFFLHSQKGIAEEIKTFLSPLDIEEIEILYVYGIGLGHHYAALKKWLSLKPQRAVVFIEEDLAVIDAFLKTAEASGFLQDPQAHLRFIGKKGKWKQVVEELAQTFPVERIACAKIASSSSPRFQALRTQLLRSSGTMHAFFTEVLHAHKLFENLHANFKKLPESFYVNQMKGAFEKIPAIICGAGPSLSQALPLLKEMEHRALIIAGGSSIAALCAGGVYPHIAMALDPNLEEYSRLKASSAFEVPFFYGGRVLNAVFATLNGPLGYMRSDTGGLFETWMENQLGIEGEAIGPSLGREALSVTTLALALAFELGCDPIILCGVDLAYTGMQRYAQGVVSDARVTLAKIKEDERALERLVRRKDRQGKQVLTLIKWIMESSAISSYAKQYPERRFINCTEGGIGFRSIAFKPLKEVLLADCQIAYDLRAYLHTEAQSALFSFLTKEKIEEIFFRVKESLARSLAICDEILKGPSFGKKILLEEDFKGEIAFDALLQLLEPALERTAQRFYWKQKEEEKSLAKWAHIKSVIEHYSQCIL